MSHIETRNVWKSVSPHDCALGLALPWSREEFLKDLEAQSFDYAKSFLKQGRDRSVLNDEARFTQMDEAWQDYERNWLKTVRRLCEEVERLGVHVIRGIRQEDLPDLFRTFEVVIPVCHFRMLNLRADDIRNVEKLEHAVVNGKRYADRAVRDIFRREKYTPGKGSDQERRAALAEMLSRQFARTHEFYQLPGAQTPSDAVGYLGRRAQDSGFWLTRELVDLEYPDSIRSGRVLELRNGLLTLQDFIDAIPESFAGILDFSCCNAILPSRIVKSAHRNCNVIGRIYPADPRALLIRLKTVMMSLSEQPRPYVVALDDYNDAVSEYVSLHSNRFWDWIKSRLIRSE